MFTGASSGIFTPQGQVPEFRANLPSCAIPWGSTDFGNSKIFIIAQKCISVEPPPSGKKINGETISSDPGLCGKAIAEALIKEGKLEDAREIATSIQSEFTRDLVYQKIAESCLNAGKLENAREIAKSIQFKFSRDWVYQKIAESYLNAGKLENAREIAKSIPSEFPRDLVYKKIAESYLNAGNLDEACSSADCIQCKAFLIAVYEKIADGCINAGNVERARDIAKRFHSKLFQDSIEVKIAKLRIKQGNLEEAKTIASSLRPGHERSFLLNLIAVNYWIKQGNMCKACAFARQIDSLCEKILVLAQIKEELEKDPTKKSQYTTEEISALQDQIEKEQQRIDAEVLIKADPLKNKRELDQGATSLVQRDEAKAPTQPLKVGKADDGAGYSVIHSDMRVDSTSLEQSKPK